MEIQSSSLSKLFIYLCVFYILINIDPIIAIFSDSFFKPDDYFYFLLPLMFLISGTILFKMGRKIGWILLTIVSTFNSLILLTGVLIYFDFFRLNQEKVIFQIVPYGTPVLYIALAGIFGIFSFLLNRENILNENKMSKNMSFLTVLFAVVLALIVIFQN